MQSTLQVAFEGIRHSDAVEACIREEAEKLEQFFGRMTCGRVAVARPQHRHRKGNPYSIRIHLAVPDAADIAVSREPGPMGAHKDIYAAIRDAFKAARRQLQDAVRKRSVHMKEHKALTMALHRQSKLSGSPAITNGSCIVEGRA